MDIKNYVIYMKRNWFASEWFEMYVIGIIQGLLYGLCAIPCNTTLWDCERFDNNVIFAVDCTNECYERFIQNVEKMYPGLCFGEERS